MPFTPITASSPISTATPNVGAGPTPGFVPITSSTPIAPQVQAPQPTLPEAGADSFIGGIFSDALKTLVVKPAVRFGQAVGNIIAPALGATPEQIAQANAQPVQLPLPGGNKGITIEPQKALDKGGVSQIASDAIKSASYLAPYGKIAGGIAADATELGAGRVASRIIGGTGAGLVGGYGADVSSGLAGSRGDTRTGSKAFIPGFATLIGGLTAGSLEAGSAGLETLSKQAQPFANEMEKQTMKLTPAKKVALGAKLDQLAQYSLDNIPAGTPEERFNYASDLYEQKEEQLQKFLTEQASKSGVDKQSFIDQLEAIKNQDQYKYNRDAVPIIKQIDGAISAINTQYPGEKIPVDKLNIFKRTAYSNAYNGAGDKVLDTVEHDIGDVARTSIEKAVKGGEIQGQTLGEFNRDYGNLIQLKQILKTAQSRPETRFAGRIAARIVGGIIGNSVGGIPGLVGGELVAEPVANKVAGTSAKTSIARKLNRISPREVGSVIQRLRP